MAKIAYVDHSYHKKTVSTKFIPELLEKKGHTVDFIWDDSWQGGNSVDFMSLLDYDSIIMFQSYAQLKEGFFSNLHPNVTYIPMLDQFGVWRGPINSNCDFFKAFQGSKIINFSFASHGMAVGMGVCSKQIRFYRKPELKNEILGLHGFFWIRLEDEISWNKIKVLLGETLFDTFHLHIAKDPGSSKIKMPSEEDIKKYNLTISTWFDKKEDFEEVLSRANVFFVPRMEEGIGQSFLEAFARGQCIVSPNNGTMNEYIQDGFTGLLYDHENIKPLDFSKVTEICDNAYRACKAGYEQWIKSQDGLVDFIMMSNKDAYKGKYDYFQEHAYTEECSLKIAMLKYLKSKLKSIPMVRYSYQKLKNLR